MNVRHALHSVFDLIGSLTDCQVCWCHQSQAFRVQSLNLFQLSKRHAANTFSTESRSPLNSVSRKTVESLYKSLQQYTSEFNMKCMCTLHRARSLELRFQSTAIYYNNNYMTPIFGKTLLVNIWLVPWGQNHDGRARDTCVSNILRVYGVF